jgi:hypothetical protein
LACFVLGCQPSWKLRRTAPEGFFSTQSRFRLDGLRYSPSLRIDDLPAPDFFRQQRKFHRDRWRILVRWLNYDFQRALLQHTTAPVSVLALTAQTPPTASTPPPTPSTPPPTPSTPPPTASEPTPFFSLRPPPKAANSKPSASTTSTTKPIFLRPVVVAIRIGQTHIQLSLPSQITLRLQVIQNNRVIEEAEFKHQSSAEIIPNLEVRLRKDAYGLGKLIASYLDRRMRGLGPPDEDS